MKSLVSMLSACAGMSAFAAIPQVSNLSIVQQPSRTVVVSYDLEQVEGSDSVDPCVVTVDFKVNGDSIGAVNFTNVTGDVNRLVDPGAGKKILWDPCVTWPGRIFSKGEFSAELTLWAKANPPKYLVKNLETLDVADDRYYAEAEAIPGGVTDRLYKSKRLVFFRVPAKGVTWKQGNPGSSGTDWYVARYVSFSQDYYFGVYEFTRAQAHYATRNWTSPLCARDEDAEDCRPYAGGGVERQLIRPVEDGWPTTGRETATGWIGEFRKTLSLDVDIPTYAEWEYANRAGQEGEYITPVFNQEFSKRVWSVYNSNGELQEVGTRLPNNWGLYDTTGNASEWVLDWAQVRNQDPVWDPKGCTQEESAKDDAGNNLIFSCGGAYLDNEESLKAWKTNEHAKDFTGRPTGFRLMAPLP